MGLSIGIGRDVLDGVGVCNVIVTRSFSGFGLGSEVVATVLSGNKSQLQTIIFYEFVEITITLFRIYERYIVKMVSHVYFVRVTKQRGINSSSGVQIIWEPNETVLLIMKG